MYEPVISSMYIHLIIIAIELDTEQEDVATKVFWPVQIQGTGCWFSQMMHIVVVD